MSDTPLGHKLVPESLPQFRIGEVVVTCNLYAPHCGVMFTVLTFYWDGWNYSYCAEENPGAGYWDECYLRLPTKLELALK